MNLFHRILSKKRKQISSSELRQLNTTEFNQLKKRKKKKILSDYSNFVGTKKFAKKVIRDLLIKRRVQNRARRIILDTEKLLSRYRVSEILEGFYKNRENEWLIFTKRKTRNTIVVTKFSFLDEPLETIKILKEIALSECKYMDVRLDFKFDYCSDIGPFLVLGVMAKNMSSFLGGGTISKSTKKVIEAVQLDNFLKMSFKKIGHIHDVWPLKLESRYASVNQATSLAGRTQKIEKVSDRFASTLDTWVGEAVECSQPDMVACLTAEGKAAITNLIGEILDNAQRHADTEKEEAGEWHIAGFMAKRPRQDDNNDYICHVSVLNLGESIGKTISGNKSKEFILNFLEKYSSRHTTLKADPDQKELLHTIAALEQGISRFATRENLAGNGMGFPNMMNFIAKFENTVIPDLEPSVTIISGRSCVNYKGKYRPGIFDKNNKHYIWLNDENSHECAPDSEFAFLLPVNFPGTILSFRFNLNKNLINENSIKKF